MEDEHSKANELRRRLRAVREMTRLSKEEADLDRLRAMRARLAERCASRNGLRGGGSPEDVDGLVASPDASGQEEKGEAEQDYEISPITRELMEIQARMNARQDAYEAKRQVVDRLLQELGEETDPVRLRDLDTELRGVLRARVGGARGIDIRAPVNEAAAEVNDTATTSSPPPPTPPVSDEHDAVQTIYLVAFVVILVKYFLEVSKEPSPKAIATAEAVWKLLVLVFLTAGAHNNLLRFSEHVLALSRLSRGNVR